MGDQSKKQDNQTLKTNAFMNGFKGTNQTNLTSLREMSNKKNSNQPDFFSKTPG